MGGPTARRLQHYCMLGAPLGVYMLLVISIRGRAGHRDWGGHYATCTPNYMESRSEVWISLPSSEVLDFLRIGCSTR